MPRSPLDHILAALNSLNSMMKRQDQLISKFAESMPGTERLLKSSEEEMDKICLKLKRGLSDLTKNISRTLPKVRESVSIVEENVPLFMAQFQADTPQTKKIGKELLDPMDGISKVVSGKAEYIQSFKPAIELMRDGKGLDVRSEAQALLLILDEIVALYNRHWFSCQDILSHLRARL